MVTVKERKSASDPVCDIPGPVLLPGCDDICQSCLSELKEGRTPADSLANGLWIGEVPPQLQNLSFTEKMLIARVKHNHCIVKVHMSGMSKLCANVVSHSLPMPKIYSVLPPRCEELSKVLAILSMAANIPVHACHNMYPSCGTVYRALRPLEYTLGGGGEILLAVTVSYDNINSYPEDEPPVIVNYSKSMESNVDPEASAVNASEEDEGADDGACPFVVHGFTGASLEHMGPTSIRSCGLTSAASTCCASADWSECRSLKCVLMVVCSIGGSSLSSSPATIWAGPVIAVAGVFSCSMCWSS
ncbi:uncharacterized protein TRAVEDRAFT_113273 [Trametes versicolor FP-101664 SS1]|uniref:uncharacterized protein n=1 Tax=Trametes versicolor (strain FP-101664) TaxID=717944 RepID=UPI00046242B6|nr:uncharacterized protein TRAVEDRAFT_113273 [Trametes versicolor FP-101664 SS1]EIW62909.1 hypothetical protein TRAVEDRAFT_113273 [Trametes versicolor FP-101664 SS1]